MLRQATNKVFIEGILSEIDLKNSSYKKNDVQVDCVTGVIKIQVEQKINDKNVTLEIPVHMFANKFKNNGDPNPAYDSIQRVMNDYVSIAAAGNKDEANIVRITSGQIQMNEYHNAAGQLISFPRISTSFITNNVKREEFEPRATFETEFVIASKTQEVDSEGVETGRLHLKGVLPQYGGRVDVVDFFTSNENVANAIDSYWSEGDTVSAHGKLNFSSKTETIIDDSGFGEPIKKVKTVNVSELLINGGIPTPMEGEFAYDTNEIQSALAERKARLEARKEKDMAKVASRQAPAQSSAGFDLGF